MNYEYLEEKVVHIFLGDGKKIDINVPLDFKVTKDWINKQASNPKTIRCEEWLKKKGFTKDEFGKWNLVIHVDLGKKPTKRISLPNFFYNEETKGLHVSFGTVIGLDVLTMPTAGLFQLNKTTKNKKSKHIDIQNFSNFPFQVSMGTDINVFYDDSIKKGIEYEFYSYYVGFRQHERDANMYCTGIHHSKNYYELFLDYMITNYPKEIETHKWPDGFLEGLTESKRNHITSGTSVAKFNL